MADPGGFGITNLQRYALGLDPHHPARADLPVAAIRQFQQPNAQNEGRYLTISFWEMMGSVDLEYYVQASNDLENWDYLWPEAYRTVEHWDADWRLVTYRDDRPIGEEPQRFLRVIVFKKSP